MNALPNLYDGGMIDHQLLEDQGVLIVHPEGKLSEADFQQLAAAVDPYIDERGGLQGLMIETKTFPGWENFKGMLSHMRFVRDHHKKIERVALVSDSRIAEFAPKLANHFVAADVRHFPYDDREAALAWVAGATS